jgi:hypothetical protein
MKNKKMMISLIAGLILFLTALCGCLESVITVGWEPVGNEETSVRLIGRIIFPEFDFWNERNCWAKIVYDTESHSNWEDYEYKYEADFDTTTDSFYVTVSNLEPKTEYHFRAVAHWPHHDNPKDQNPESITQQGEDLAFILGNFESYKIEINNIKIKKMNLENIISEDLLQRYPILIFMSKSLQ